MPLHANRGAGPPGRKATPSPGPGSARERREGKGRERKEGEERRRKGKREVRMVGDKVPGTEMGKPAPRSHWPTGMPGA